MTETLSKTAAIKLARASVWVSGNTVTRPWDSSEPEGPSTQNTYYSPAYARAAAGLAKVYVALAAMGLWEAQGLVGGTVCLGPWVEVLEKTIAQHKRCEEYAARKRAELADQLCAELASRPAA